MQAQIYLHNKGNLFFSMPSTGPQSTRGHTRTRGHKFIELSRKSDWNLKIQQFLLD